MELQQLQLGDKVKLQLIQPNIKCSGRDTVSCFYRGYICDLKLDHIKIRFKYKGFFIEHWYNLIEKCFVDEEIQDIKII